VVLSSETLTFHGLASHVLDECWDAGLGDWFDEAMRRAVGFLMKI
jgi:hypothetical protein